MGTESRRVVVRYWREQGMGELLFNGIEFQLFKMKRVTEVDGGDAFTTLQM